MAEKSLHVILSDENFEREVLGNKNVVLVLCEAEWCGSCKIIMPVLDQLADEYKGQIKMCRLDVDKNRHKATEYCVQNLPTLMFFNNGEVIDQITGVFPKKLVTAILKPLLKNKSL